MKIQINIVLLSSQGIRRPKNHLRLKLMFLTGIKVRRMCFGKNMKSKGRKLIGIIRDLKIKGMLKNT
ncbi:hypothetical protein CFD74_10795 [Salmonella enterica]|nr:hypothetical protein [Salmonella enterica]EBV8457764.1 hypothetical protein [Salmonella enterica subsp. enterica serovar Javiana]ECC3691587.1 hypothetical protein [Salmonella enterica subsp. enterica]EAB2697629.1 hypothetical protein [Salmonella enterica]EAB5123996.1 hypothetical protein [Salmonella enterica]